MWFQTRRMRACFRIPALIAFCLASVGCKEEGTIKVNSITFEGVTAVDESRLREALATQQSAMLPWVRKRYFDRARFDQDLQRIQAFYTDRGYPDARVTSFDVKLNNKQDAVDVVLTILEGEPVSIAAINFLGFDVIPADHFADLQGKIPLQVSRPRDRQLVVQAHEMALNELRDHGYPYANVATAETGADSKRATITFTAEPGTLAHFGETVITGNTTVGENVIRRELGFKPGDLYRRSVLQNTQRRLYGMTLFQFVNVETLEPDLQEAIVRTKVTVAEGKHQRENLGVGYGTEEKVRVDGEYTHVNFLGAARSAGVHARWSSLDRGVRLQFNQPYFFQPHFSLGVDAQQWYTFTPAYNSTVTGGRATVLHRDGPATSWSVSIASEKTSSAIAEEVLNDPELRDDLIALGLDPTTGKQEGTLSALGVDFQRSTADNLLNPTRGFQLGVHAEQAGVLLPGTFNYYSIAADTRHYQPIGEDFVLATRLQLGNIAATGADATNVPFSKKYFLGGAATLRGWGRYEVGPLSEGLPIGGNSFLAFSIEGRAHLKGKLGGVLFLDAGNVWEDSGGFALNDLRYAVGPGLRYQTPVGPIRLDVGYQLTPIDELLVNGAPQSHRFRIHFSIGQAF